MTINFLFYLMLAIYVSSFSNISYLSNIEYWSQKRIQRVNIHSIKLDVYAVKQSVQSYSFNWEHQKTGKKLNSGTKLDPYPIHSGERT